MSKRTIEVQLDAYFKEYAERLSNDQKLKTQVNQMFAEKCDPYVPYITGALANTITVDENGITYEQPYASNVYYSMNVHNKEFHPLASSMWDDVAFANHKDEITDAAAKLVEQRLKEMLKNG